MSSTLAASRSSLQPHCMRTLPPAGLCHQLAVIEGMPCAHVLSLGGCSKALAQPVLSNSTALGRLSCGMHPQCEWQGCCLVAATAAALAAHRWTKQLLALVSAKGEKIAVRIQGPYCALPKAQPAGRLPSRPLASSSRPDGIIIIAGEPSTQRCLSCLHICV